MTAVVTLKPGIQGRHYRLPTENDYKAVWKAQQRLKAILDEWERGGKKGLCPVPDEPTPAGGGSGAGRAFSVQKYGMMKWGDLFTARQKTLLLAVADSAKTNSDKDMISLLALAYGRCVDHWSANAMWIQDLEAVAHTFGRQALPIVWDFVEAVGLGDGGATYKGQIDWVARVIESNGRAVNCAGQTQIVDASHHPLPDESTSVWFTDPPYYDAIPYSDLSDYFFVWDKRILPDNTNLHDPYDSTNILTPKLAEAVQDETKTANGNPKNREFFEAKMAECFSEGRRLICSNGVGSVVFAHKTTEGWEALLSGLLRGGWVITASWPVSTERPVRLRSLQSAALAGSVHLVCRPRSENAPVGDWGDVLKELPKRVGDWMERLQSEGIRGADLVFACIGPALEIYSRYSKVETADGKEVKLDAYLEKVWEVVGRIALENILGTEEAQARNGMAGVLEEDARLTALFLWTLQSTKADVTTNGKIDEDDDTDEDDDSKTSSKGFSLVYDVARRFAQPLGVHLDAWEGRIIETKKGVVRLFSVSERAKALFGDAGASAVAHELEIDPAKAAQFELSLNIAETAPKIKNRGRRKKAAVDITDEDFSTEQQATTLDRVHAAMLLQKAGRANALRALLKAEQQRGTDFLRLANALSALYPKNSEEKRLLDAMLLAVPR